MKTDADLEINGSPPELAGYHCQGLVCEQYWYQGVLEAPANVIYLSFESRCHRLCFDYGTIFWRVQLERPAPYTMAELDAETRMDDLGARLGVVGAVLSEYVATPILGGSEVELRFQDGTRVMFRNTSDHTTIHVVRES